MIVIQDLFVNKRMYKAVNNTLVIIIPKSGNACMVEDYSPFSYCTILYNLISKVLANMLSKVLGSIMDVI